jgi:hypothetical protein
VSLLARRLSVGAEFTPLPGGDFDFPSPVRDRAITELNGASSPGTINYPASVSAGDRLILWLAGDTAQTFGVSDWTELDQVSGTDSFGLFWKTADGTEGGTTFSVTFTTNSRDISAIVWAVPSVGDVEATAIQTGTGASITLPDLTPAAGEDQYLWLVLVGFNGGANLVTEWPDGVGGWFHSAAPGSSVSANAGEFVLTAASDGLSTVTLTGSVFNGAAIAAVPVVTADVSEYPRPVGVAESVWGTLASTQTMNLPSGIVSGDILVAEVSVGSDRTPTITGWDTVATDNQSTFIRTRIFKKVADGGEGSTVTVDLDGTAKGSAICRRIENADATKIEAATAAALEAAITFPTLTPAAGSDKILWIVGAGVLESRTPFFWPLGMFESPAWIRGGAGTTDTASYSQAVFAEASSLSPAAGEIVNSRKVAFVIAVYP